MNGGGVKDGLTTGGDDMGIRGLRGGGRAGIWELRLGDSEIGGRDDGVGRG
jgi:hypothetical protein